MATKTTTKTNRNVKAAAKATTTKAIKKNATVAKPAAKESKPTNKMSQIEAAVAVLAKSKEPMNCKTMVEAMQGEGLWTSPGGAGGNGGGWQAYHGANWLVRGVMV